MHLSTLTAPLLLTTVALSQSWNGWEQPKSNILFIFTDDQDLELGSLQFLPSVVSRVKDVGKKCHWTQEQGLIKQALRSKIIMLLSHCAAHRE